MNLLLYIFASIGAIATLLVAFVTAVWFVARAVAYAEIRRKARQASLTPTQPQ